VKVIINAPGYGGQSSGAGGAGVFLQYLTAHLAESCEVDVLVSQHSKSFKHLQSAARFIELPYLTPETLRHLRSGPTVVLDPYGGLPCASFPEDMALCVVVHDLMHLERPHFFTASERDGRSFGFAAGMQRADAIVTFSADQARAVRRYFPGTNPAVIPHLPYMCLKDATAHGGSRTLAGDLGKFILLPAVKWPHKNHKTLIEAFRNYITHTGSSLRLVMCGGPCAESRFSFFPELNDSDQIIDLGLVSDADLAVLYENAAAVVFPTLYEGFGIPVLEAAYQGKMVIASRLAVFDEILGPTTYRAVEDSLCHLRWMEALADVEAASRERFETRALQVRQKIDLPRSTSRFVDVLKAVAERYTHPALYPVRSFPEGDRLTSGVACQLAFHDVYGATVVERGARQATLGAKPATQPSTIFRGAGLEPAQKSCLRAHYDHLPASAGLGSSFTFCAWVRLASDANIEELRWSANDGFVTDLLPELRDGEWHIIRFPVPASGYIDFRGYRAGQAEVAGFDLEIHAPMILQTVPVAPPDPAPLSHGLTVMVAAFSKKAKLAQIVAGIRAAEQALHAPAAVLNWVVVTRLVGLGKEPIADLPNNVRVLAVGAGDFTRADATSLVSPYQPISQLLLIEAADLPACLDPDNLKIIGTALWHAPTGHNSALVLGRNESGFWLEPERGKILQVAHRIGEPVPLLDPGVIASCISAKSIAARPKFAVIETDQTSNLSHHVTVSSLFLTGAESIGFIPVFGLNKSAKGQNLAGVETWAGFSSQVYSVGSADAFTSELAQFVEAAGLGANDIVFMHSLSPQIVLGTARFIAANPQTSPRFAMRFFSTAEAMAGHRLSYVKILKSIASVRIVRERMSFFCESRNLITYYEEEVGRSYPLLFNPEHPSLAAVRASSWTDTALAGGKAPMLAYFGEAREEKGFDLVPGIVRELLQSPQMAAFEFLIQTGSNRGNDTPKMARAKAALAELKQRYPGRVRTFEQAETPEQFYFLMKHARGVIAPYSPLAYGKRGTGVTLEALQLGLEVFTWQQTDLYATFHQSGKVIGVAESGSFADTIAAYYAAHREPAPIHDLVHGLALRQTATAVCERLMSLCGSAAEAERNASRGEPVLWVGNDTLGEGCSSVYAAQKEALGALGRDCLELFVPWPDRNWSGVEPGAYDAKIYGFGTAYESAGLAWVAKPSFDAEMLVIIDDIERNGPSFQRLKALNGHFKVPATLKQAIASNRVERTILNYAHLYPAIEGLVPLEKIVCETHDIMSYANAVRRNGVVSIAEKIAELSALAQFRQLIAISVAERREIAAACPASAVFWKVRPFVPETRPPNRLGSGVTDVDSLCALGGVPADIVRPSVAMFEAFHRRGDLRELFELDSHDDRMAYFRWWAVCGQFETGHGFGLTKKQLDWLFETSPGSELAQETGTKTRSLTGLQRLVVSLRPDVHASFSSDDGIDIVGLSGWMDAAMEQEFGFSSENLVRRGNAALAQASAHRDSLADTGAALDAVFAAGTANLTRAGDVAEHLFNRIARVEQIDLLLVGSAHPANLKSFEWFLDEVYAPYFARKKVNLFMVGTACEHFAKLQHDNVFLLGKCERLDPLLEAARACPLPIVFGSGTPIKAISAFALNGVVTVTDHVERAFGLAEYGIPAFSDPQEFAADLDAMLSDQVRRHDRQTRTARYVQENLTPESYIEFWRERLEG